ncbi:MAG: LysM peptidoglycan-binding domain-containing protein [Anaerolineae bacterium]
MAKKKEEKKGLLGKALDAVTARDEKEAAEEAAEEAATAEAKAAREATKRRLAEARQEQLERKAAQSEAAAEEAQQKVEELEEKLAKLEAQVKEAETQAAIKAKQEEARAKLEAYQAKKEEEAAPPVYVVKSGDNLSKIAKEQLGDASRWPEIFEMNKIRSPTRISSEWGKSSNCPSEPDRSYMLDLNIRPVKDTLTGRFCTQLSHKYLQRRHSFSRSQEQRGATVIPPVLGRACKSGGLVKSF